MSTEEQKATTLVPAKLSAEEEATAKYHATPTYKFLTIGLPILIVLLLIGIGLGVYFGVYYNKGGGSGPSPPPPPPPLATPMFVDWAELDVPVNADELPWCLETSVRVARAHSDSWSNWSEPVSSLVDSIPLWRVAGLDPEQEVKFQRRTGTAESGSAISLERAGNIFTDNQNPCPGVVGSPTFTGFTANAANEAWACPVSYQVSLGETGPWSTPVVVLPAQSRPDANPRFSVAGLLNTDTLYWERRVGTTGAFTPVTMTRAELTNVFTDLTPGPCQETPPGPPPPPPPDREVNVPISESGRTFYINQYENTFYYAIAPRAGRIKIGDLLADLETAFLTGRREGGFPYPLRVQLSIDASGFMRTVVPSSNPGFGEGSRMRVSYAQADPGIKPPTTPATPPQQEDALNSRLGYQLRTPTVYFIASEGELATRTPTYIAE